MNWHCTKRTRNVIFNFENVGTNSGNGKEKKYRCRIVGGCNFSTTYLPNRRVHELRQHSTQRPVRCQLCPKKFLYPSELRFHLRKHTQEKPFKCNYCAYESQSAIVIRNHERRHDTTKDRQKVASLQGQEDYQNKPSITRVFICGFCDLVSADYNEILVHSVSHRILYISLERIAVL